MYLREGQGAGVCWQIHPEDESGQSMLTVGPVLAATSAPRNPSTPICAHCRGNERQGHFHCHCRWQVPMTHNMRNPGARGQTISAWAWPSMAARSAHPPHHSNQESATGHTSVPGMVPGLGCSTRGPMRTPGGPGPGHGIPRPPNKGGLCAANRRQGSKPPRTSRQVPAAARGFLRLQGPGSAGGLHPQPLPLDLPSLSQRKAREE